MKQIPSRVNEIFGTAYPIALGPMRQITLGAMAGAVSAAGGFGQIAASGLNQDALRREIETARSLTDRPVGVNIPVYRPNAAEMLETAIDMGIETITTSAGNPATIMERAGQAGLRVAHKVSTVSMGRKAQAAGVDAVIAMGFEAGGHVGREKITTMCLVPQLVDALSVPVIAAGGIADARGMVAALALGAEGVEIGTRFVATVQAPVPDFFKDKVAAAECDSTLLLGQEAMPIRVLRNAVTALVAGMDQAEADRQMVSKGDATYVQAGGTAETAVMPCGQAAGLVGTITGVAEILDEIVTGAAAIAGRLATGFAVEEAYE
ncbi:MAG: NAD(P)H-dependent flavin oxidoreductase [Desulfosudaceae bacterium]